MINKKAYEFSFSWIFAILVGSVIIFLAVYTATKVVEIKQLEQETVAGKQIGILLTPVETFSEEGKSSLISLREQTTIFNDCSNRGTFGSQDISTLIDSQAQGVKSSFHNKYLFSSAQTTGKKEFYVLSKPFSFPFKISDLIILWSDQEKYCFVNSPREIEQQMEGLKNINITGNLENCPDQSTKVCFEISGCGADSIKVSYNDKKVTHPNSEPVYYVEALDDDKYALLYAAIFSDPKVYECQVKRLMARASELANLYEEKSKFLSPKGCGSATLQQELSAYKSKANSFSTISDIKDPGFFSIAISLKNKNDNLLCELF